MITLGVTWFFNLTWNLKCHRFRTKLRAGFSEIVVAVESGDARIDEDKEVDVGQGHERKEFCVFEPVEAVNVIVHYTRVIG